MPPAYENGTSLSATPAHDVEMLLAPSGKSAKGENFPVASLLLAKEHRASIAAFYAFARAADDIADAPHLRPEDKCRRLDLLAHALERVPEKVPLSLNWGLSDQDTPGKKGKEPFGGAINTGKDLVRVSQKWLPVLGKRHGQNKDIEPCRESIKARQALDGTADPVDQTGPAHLIDCLRDELARHGLGRDHAHHLLSAFRQDARKTRYRSLDELLDYCTKSADPVGRFLLDLHGEDPALYDASDGLCTALQLLNHLQDCGDDYAKLDRVYLPQEWLQDAGTECAALADCATSPALRQVLNRALDVCDARLDLAARLGRRLKNRRLAAEAEVIYSLARRLAQRLRREDPLKSRVRLSKLDFVWAGLRGVGRLVRLGNGKA